MEAISSTEIIRLLHAKETPLFSLNELGGILGVENRQTLYKKVQRLEKSKIFKKLIKGKYLFLLKPIEDFTIANFLYQPSYVSLESALSFYSIITGFPYQITSITVKKPKEFNLEEKEYSFSQISPDLFWGWEKKENFLIALPEKALLDYLYFSQKGLRNLDWAEIEATALNKDLLLSWAKKFNDELVREIKKNI
jgi:predicted transcriptional regulator of viral defense system